MENKIRVTIDPILKENLVHLKQILEKTNKKNKETALIPEISSKRLFEKLKQDM